MVHVGTLFIKLFSLFTIQLWIQVFAHWLNMSTTGIWDKNTALDIERNDCSSDVLDEPKSTHKDIQVLFTSSKNLIQIFPSIHNAEMVHAVENGSCLFWMQTLEMSLHWSIWFISSYPFVFVVFCRIDFTTPECLNCINWQSNSAFET